MQHTDAIYLRRARQVAILQGQGFNIFWHPLNFARKLLAAKKRDFIANRRARNAITRHWRAHISNVFLQWDFEFDFAVPSKAVLRAV